MTPFQRYQQHLADPDFIHDPAQEHFVELLQAVFDQLVPEPAQRRQKRTLVARLRGQPTILSWEPKVKGLYLWGGVGRGKTYLVDTFYECVPHSAKVRTHFHRFMQKIHHRLRALKETQDPLRIVATDLANQARLICLDEFFVADITDAMLLAGLLDSLFERGVTMVATSNTPPHKLYENGLQRARFLPAIALIEEHMQVVHLDAAMDYRLRQLERAEIYHWPLDSEADTNLESTFHHLAPDPGIRAATLEIENRQITTRWLADGVVWFEFGSICDGPRGTADYIEVARCFHTVLVSDVPVLDRLREDQAHRFLNLVDEFYDRNVKLVISAAAPIDNLYVGKRLTFEFQRVRSRLHEMQSHDYLALQHLP
jgi:cell division protein ZapE